jgi:hypothetical protein
LYGVGHEISTIPEEASAAIAEIILITAQSAQSNFCVDILLRRMGNFRYFWLTAIGSLRIQW